MGLGDLGRRPEELFNRYVNLRIATANIASALGFLALLWSTVVLLGGFVSVLRVKDFWVLTALSFLMAFRMAKISTEEFHKGIYVEEAKIIFILKRHKWIETHKVIVIVVWIAFVMKLILNLCFILLFHVSPLVSLGFSLWRLVERDYGDAGGDTANRAKLIAALDIFYALTLFQGLFSLYLVVIVRKWARYGINSLSVAKHCGLGDEEWGCQVVKMYRLETRRKFGKDGVVLDNWNMIAYAVELLQSASGDDHLWGVRVLDQLYDKDPSIVTQKLLFSRLSIMNLISMIGLRGTDNTEKRERAARIVAHLACELNITHFPGTLLQCICSLLDSSKQSCEPQVTEKPDDEHRPPDQNESLEASQHQHDALLLTVMEDQTDGDHEQVSSSSSDGSESTTSSGFIEAFLQGSRQGREATFRFASRGTKELISQGLLILERLTQDEENCIEMSKHQRLLSKITSPLLISHGLQILERLTQDEENCIEISKHLALLSKITSPLSTYDFVSYVQDRKKIKMLSNSLTVVSRLLTSPGAGATRLRQKLASNTEAVSNLIAILENCSQSAQELHERALEILTELAFDDSFKNVDFDKLLKAMLRIFLEEEASSTIVESEQATDTEKATRLRGKAGEALARLLPVRKATARGANVADVPLSKQDAINLLTKVLHQILSSKMGTSADAATGAGGRNNNRVAENVLESDLLEEADSVQPRTQGDEQQSEERKLVAAMLSVAMVMCNENVISKEDFAHATPEDATLAKKLKEVLESNKNSTADCLRVVKLTCQVVIAMIQAKPSYIKHFNEHKFKEALTEALDTKSELDDYMLFAGNDREVVKPARSLASLVNEARKLLETAQDKQGSD